MHRTRNFAMKQTDQKSEGQNHRDRRESEKKRKNREVSGKTGFPH